MRRRSVRFLLAAVLVFGGCASYRSPADGRTPSLGWKVVMEKAPPAYLIAVDRMECTVSRDRFEKVSVGDRVLCAWRESGFVAR
jgi:hypothetical protein